MVICAVYGCNSRSGRDKVSFFSFPADTKFRKLWCERLGRGHLGNKTHLYIPTAHSRICSKHFEDCHYVQTSEFLKAVGFKGKCLKRLRADAVPSVFGKFEKNQKTRPSTESLLAKRHRIEVIQKVNLTSNESSKPESELTGELLLDGPLTATPVFTGLDTLADAACAAAELQEPSLQPIQNSAAEQQTPSMQHVPKSAYTAFSIQCQTPSWSNEVKNSHAMELEGMKRSLNFLMKENNLDISHVVTDRHSSVKKYMREHLPNVTHWFDVWHMAKGVHKKLEAAGKKKGCEKVKLWSRSVSNHLYWVASSSKGDGELAQQKWLSILKHVTNIHEGHGDRFPACEHGEITERLWMKKGCKPHHELTNIVQSPYLVKDIKQLSPAEQTSELEAFHKVLCGWVPKFNHYMYTNMDSRSKVAALHFNENAGRKLSQSRRGNGRYTVSYPRSRKGEPVVKEVKTVQTFGYVSELIDCVMELRQDQSSYRIAKETQKEKQKHRPCPLAHSTPRQKNVPKQELIDAHVSRFSKSRTSRT